MVCRFTQHVRCSESQNLPAYVVLDDPLGLPVNGVQNWQAGFLPPVYQGMRLRSVGSPILTLQPERKQAADVVQAERELLSRLDQIHKRNHPGQLLALLRALRRRRDDP